MKFYPENYFCGSDQPYKAYVSGYAREDDDSQPFPVEFEIDVRSAVPISTQMKNQVKWILIAQDNFETLTEMVVKGECIDLDNKEE